MYVFWDKSLALKRELLFFVSGSSKASASFPLFMARSIKLRARVRVNMASSSLSLMDSRSNLQGPLVETLTKVIQGLQKLLWNHLLTKPERFSEDFWPWVFNHGKGILDQQNLILGCDISWFNLDLLLNNWAQEM